MLYCHRLENPDDCIQKFENLNSQYEFHPETQPPRSGSLQWVVSSLETKLSFQNILLEQTSAGVLSGDPVLRANEFWRQSLLKLFQFESQLSVDSSSKLKKWQLIDKSISLFFLKSLIEDFNRDTELFFSPQDFPMALQILNQLLPILTHEHGYEAFRSWIENKQDSVKTWITWYGLSQYLWTRLNQERWIPESLVCGALIETTKKVNQLAPWDVSAFAFHLGYDIDGLEVENIIELARQKDVHVLVPDLCLEDPNSYYHDLLNISETSLKPKKRESSTGAHTYLRYPSMLSEVKQAVNQVRRWLESGVPVHEIAIVSPIIENYWPTLSEYLKVEGVPCGKTNASPWKMWPAIQQWLARLENEFVDITTNNLQADRYLLNQDPSKPFAQFLHYYKNIVSKEILEFESKELQCAAEGTTKQESTYSGDSLVTWEEFIHCALAYWPHDNLDEVEGWFDEFDELWAVDLTLSFSNWISYLQLFFSRKENSCEPVSEKGLHVLSLDSVESLKIDKMIVMGLNEKNLKAQVQNGIPFGDILSLKSLFGFNIPHPERDLTNKKLHWLSLKDSSEIYFFSAEHDFFGTFETSSLFWLKGAMAHETLEVRVPNNTRWDTLMESVAQGSPQSLWLEEEDYRKFLRKIARDRAQEPFAAEQTLSERIAIDGLSLSASTIDEYHKCPFRFLGQKGFHLRMVPSLDLDVDYQTRGRMLHKICELVLNRSELSLEASFIEDILDEAEKSVELMTPFQKVWENFRVQYFHWVKAFIEFEKNWRETYPDTKKFETELSVKGFVDIENPELFSTQQGTSGFGFRGMVDRLDQGPDGSTVVIDYKSSAAGLTQYGSWVENGLFQLIVYSLALRQGLGGKNWTQIHGAYYLVLRDLERKRGLHDINNPLFLPEVKRKKMSFEDLLISGEGVVRTIVNQISLGKFSPQPIDEKVCKNCYWDRICRQSKMLTQ